MPLCSCCLIYLPNSDFAENKTECNQCTTTKSKAASLQNNSLFRLEQIANKGLGYIANAKISAGQLILQDQAICSSFIPHSAPTSLAWKKLEAQFATFLLENHPTLNLHVDPEMKLDHKVPKNCKDSELWKNLMKQILRSAFQIHTGGFGVTSQSGACLAIFATVARFNHNCTPNAAFKGIPSDDAKEDESFVRVIYALRDIEPNEEMCINYLSTETLPFFERRKKLLHWGFACSCAKCISKVDSELLFAINPKGKKIGDSEIDVLFNVRSMEKLTAAQWERKIDMYQKAYNSMEYATTHWKKCKIRFDLLTIFMGQEYAYDFLYQLLGEELETLHAIAAKFDYAKVVVAKQIQFLYEESKTSEELTALLNRCEPDIEEIIAKYV
jgi:hypothetical protein